MTECFTWNTPGFSHLIPLLEVFCMKTRNKLVILDRDGVINHDSEDHIRSLDEWHPFPTAIEAIARLNKEGWHVGVATNQSGIARGYFDATTVKAIHEELLRLVERAGGHIDHIAFCPHGPEDGCNCRKPRPGLLREIGGALGLGTLENAWMVGDSLRDLQAGDAVGCRLALVRTGKGKAAERAGVPDRALVFDDLQHFVDWLLQASC
jgi:D-glycero-D-manno-heptose 1,7-bisphosphate phosphatase